METNAFTDALLEEAARLGVALDAAQIDAFRRHYALIRRWNPRVRLTGSTDPVRVARELFADTLAASRFIDTRLEGQAAGALRAIDIGAGAGLPGIPLKVLHPAWALTVIDSNAKRIAFLKELVRALDLADTRIVRGRAEQLAHDADLRERFDLALCRAVASPQIACELAAPFVTVGGSYIAQTGEPAGEPLRSAAEQLSSTLVLAISYSITGSPRQRNLMQIQKHSTTPPQFPRDHKIIKKQPLI
jgi:16S rRNA (guanine527-N7)-methyltransferase